MSPSSSRNFSGGRRQRVNGRRKDVLAQHQPAVWRHDDALRREQAVGHALALLLERRENRHELADELRGELWTVSVLLDLRQPASHRVIRDERESVFLAEPLHGPHLRDRRVREVRQFLHPAAKGVFETRLPC